MSIIDRAVRALERGQVVLYPTDTLLGLATLPRSDAALARLFEVKRRPQGAPVSLAFSSFEEIEPYAELNPAGRRVVRELLPGAFTVLVRPSAHARKVLPRALFGPGGTLGVRLPDHPVARELSRRVGGPVTSTSANLHDEPPCRSVAEARRKFGKDVAVYLPAEPPPSGRPSRLLDLTGPRPRWRKRR